MTQIFFGDVSYDIPPSWSYQSMTTFTLPSMDKSIRPNIIATREPLRQPSDVNGYYEKVKQSILARQIPSFEILDESELSVAGCTAKQLICKWDIATMQPPKETPSPAGLKGPQWVNQIHLCLIKNEVAYNMTASFPAEQFAIYQRSFDKLVSTFSF